MHCKLDYSWPDVADVFIKQRQDVTDVIVVRETETKWYRTRFWTC